MRTVCGLRHQTNIRLDLLGRAQLKRRPRLTASPRRAVRLLWTVTALHHQAMHQPHVANLQQANIHSYHDNSVGIALSPIALADNRTLTDTKATMVSCATLVTPMLALDPDDDVAPDQGTQSEVQSFILVYCRTTQTSSIVEHDEHHPSVERRVSRYYHLDSVMSTLNSSELCVHSLRSIRDVDSHDEALEHTNVTSGPCPKASDTFQHGAVDRTTAIDATHTSRRSHAQVAIDTPYRCAGCKPNIFHSAAVG